MEKVQGEQSMTRETILEDSRNMINTGAARATALIKANPAVIGLGLVIIAGIIQPIAAVLGAAGLAALSSNTPEAKVEAEEDAVVVPDQDTVTPVEGAPDREE